MQPRSTIRNALHRRQATTGDGGVCNFIDMIYTYTVQSEDINEIKAVMRWPEYLSCLHDLYQEFRKRAKYDDSVTTWEEAYTLLWEIISEHAVNPIEE